MNDKICIFAGTTEGRTLAALLRGAASLTICVATEYGETVLDGIDGITVRQGRMNKEQMIAFFSQSAFSMIIDATHPYAKEVTENIRAACEETGIEMMRVLRDVEGMVKDAVYVSSVGEACDYLKEREGNIFITTGAKELASYASLDMERVWARVLPSADSLEACRAAGLHPSHIIAAQGPFTRELNAAQLKMIDARYLVTKSSGKAGGFDEKIGASLETGATPVIIGAIEKSSGVPFDEAVSLLKKKYKLSKKKITVVGIGPGNEDQMSAEAKETLRDCDVIIGAKPVTDTLKTNRRVYNEYLPQKIAEILKNDDLIDHAAVVMRGDTGFFSGAKKLSEAFETEDITFIPGIASPVYFAAKLGVSWDDARLVSLHGRNCNIVRTVCRNEKTFVLTGGDNTAEAILQKLCAYGLGHLYVCVGEKLSYDDEKISKGTAEELKDGIYDKLSIVYIENKSCDKGVKIGLPDESFVRGDTPMTKSEVRAVSLSKLALDTDSVVWDIGAGTGSVSVECALAAYGGTVYAVEKDADAADLIKENKYRFKADNIEIINGKAPEYLEALPAPTHVFIGGSCGEMQSIISAVLKKNADAKIVINAASLETQSEVLSCAERFGFKEFEAVSVNVSRSRKLGKYNMMSALNPVVVYYMHGGHYGD